MDDQRVSAIRFLSAKLTAQQFVIDYLLSHVWQDFPKRERLAVADALLNNAEWTEHLRGVAQDDFHAESLADIVAQAQHEVEQIIGRALQATEAAEGG